MFFHVWVKIILMKFANNNDQVKFRPRIEPEKQRALASFHFMNSVKVVMVVMIVTMIMMMMIMMMMIIIIIVIDYNGYQNRCSLSSTIPSGQLQTRLPPSLSTGQPQLSLIESNFELKLDFQRFIPQGMFYYHKKYCF